MINILDRINKLYNKNELIIQIEKSIKPKEIIDIKPADIKLISKHFDDYKKIETLLGPSSLATYEIEGRTILFFRDIHIPPKNICYDKCNPEKCMWISDFLKDLFKITPKCIDFFVKQLNGYKSKQNLKIRKIMNI